MIVNEIFHREHWQIVQHEGEKKVKIYCNKQFKKEVKTTKENLTDAELLKILRLYEIETR